MSRWYRKSWNTTWLMGLSTLSLGLGGACKGKNDDPSLTRNVTSASLRYFESCGELEGRLKSNLKAEMELRLRAQDGGGGWGLAEDDVAESAGAEESNAAPVEGEDFSGTNNQEAGVDEADIVKTDGRHIYTLNGDRVEILGVPEFGQLEHAGTIQVDGYPSALLLDGDRLAVLSRVSFWNLDDDDPVKRLIAPDRAQGAQDSYWYGGSNLTKIALYDVSEVDEPQLVRTTYVEGSYNTARETEGTLRIVSTAQLDIQGVQHWVEIDDERYWDLPWDHPMRERIFEEALEKTVRNNNEAIDRAALSDFIPAVYERRGDEVEVHPITGESCTNFGAGDDSLARGVTSITTLRIDGNNLDLDADHVLANWPVVYASTDTLVLAEQSWDWWWWVDRDENQEFSTNLHRFDISAPRRTSYTGSGRVEGQINDQFALSEHRGDIRVMATANLFRRWWLDEAEPVEPDNRVYVLRGEDNLRTIGEVRGIAEGETIWSSRFAGDVAYMVTFRQVDPLFTVDLHDPSNPRVLGELKVEGVSTYIHPLDEEHLLTIGIAGDANGLDWTAQVSLFDVADLEAPTLIEEHPLADPANDDSSWSSAWSEAQWEHKAFTYWAPEKMLAVPTNSWREWQSAGGDYQWEYRSELQLISVDPERGNSLRTHGVIDHSGFYEEAGDDDYYRWSAPSIRRSIFMGDFIYAISDRGVTVHETASLELQGDVSLPGGYAYWY